MYARTKVAKGHTYYQIVEGVRDGDKVRQRVILALGRGVPTIHLGCDSITEDLDPPAMLGFMRRRLAGMRQRRRFAAECVGTSKTRERRLAGLDRQIAALTRKVEILAGIIKNGLLSTREAMAQPAVE
jgi:hypothetical protein